MPNLTPRLGIKKPIGTENVTRISQNENWDIVDATVETPAGAQIKAEAEAGAALSSAKSYTDQQVGDISLTADNISATGNTNVQAEIDSLKSSGSDAKSSIAASIAAMNQNAEVTMTWAQLAALIEDISNDATATASQVLDNESFYEGGLKRIGNMPNRGDVDFTPNNTTQVIPDGYHNGNGRVGAVLFDTSKVLDNTVIAGTEGTMPNRGSVTPTIITQNGQYTIPSGYHSGLGKVTASLPVKSSGYATDSLTHSGNQLRMSVDAAGYFSESAYLHHTDNNWIEDNIRDGVDVLGKIGTLQEKEPVISSKQTGIIDMSSTQTIAISPVDLSRSVVIVHATGEGGHEELFVRAFFDSSSAIKISPGSVTQYVDAYWEVIEFNGVKSLQSGTNGSYSTSTYVATINAVDPLKCMVFFSVNGSQPTSFAHYLVTYEFTSSSEITFRRQATGASPYIDISWFVVEFE